MISLSCLSLESPFIDEHFGLSKNKKAIKTYNFWKIVENEVAESWREVVPENLERNNTSRERGSEAGKDIQSEITS